MTAPTLGRHVSRVRAQRLVAQGRMLISSFALLAAVIGVAKYGDSALPAAILGGWAVVAVLAKSRSLLVLDLVVIGATILTTGGVASPFWPLLVLPPFTAMLLYSRRALALTVVACVAVFFTALSVTHAATDTRMMIMRLGVALLLALAAVRRSDHDEGIQRDLERLATWPRGVAADRDAFLREQLACARTALRAPHAALAWREGEDAYVAILRDETFTLRDETLAPPGDQPLLDKGEIAQRLGAQTVIGAPFTSQTASGWLFALDPRTPDTDLMMLAEVVARLVSASMDEQNVAAMMRDGAAANERLRLSRDLHDGLLQSLGGLALHAQVARRAIASDPSAAETRLAAIVNSLTDAQRTLRDFVDELRPELAARDTERAASMHADVLALLTEAVTNAVKHAEATNIACNVSFDAEHICIEVRDDGRGFPFQGRFDLQQLIESGRGPWSLKERVAARGGELLLDSSPDGTRIAVRLPC